MNHHRSQELLDALTTSAPGQRVNINAQWISTASDVQILHLLGGLTSFLERSDEPHRWDPTLEAILLEMVRRFQEFRSTHAGLPSDLVKQIARLYSVFGKQSQLRHHLLTVLATGLEKNELSTFAELIVADPPLNSALAAAPFLTLMRSSSPHLRIVFPRLLDGISHVSIAAPILDLANFMYRKGHIELHPASARATRLLELMDGIINGLESIESDSNDDSLVSSKLRDQVSDSISLLISLCDALALCEESQAVTKLRRAMDLKHRRIRVEAAAALARLGENEGVQRLLELATEPVARLRVLAYLDELGRLEELPEGLKTPAARAEAELCAYLAEPMAMGVAPTECELIDSRTQYWPGYDHRVACYLFRFTYRFTRGHYSNIAIAGPLIHTFQADLTDLSPEDIYAAYAGWHAEHDDIREQNLNENSCDHDPVLGRLRQQLVDNGFEAVVPALKGQFFGENVLVAHARKGEVDGVAVVDSLTTAWYPTSTTSRPLGPDLAYCLYKGRRLLKSFNENSW